MKYLLLVCVFFIGCSVPQSSLIQIQEEAYAKEMTSFLAELRAEIAAMDDGPKRDAAIAYANSIQEKLVTSTATPLDMAVTETFIESLRERSQSLSGKDKELIDDVIRTLEAQSTTINSVMAHIQSAAEGQTSPAEAVTGTISAVAPLFGPYGVIASAVAGIAAYFFERRRKEQERAAREQAEREAKAQREAARKIVASIDAVPEAKEALKKNSTVVDAVQGVDGRVLVRDLRQG